MADNKKSGVQVFIYSGYLVDLRTHGIDLNGDGKWNPGDYIQVTITDLSTDPCPVTVSLSGTIVLDVQVNIWFKY